MDCSRGLRTFRLGSEAAKNQPPGLALLAGLGHARPANSRELMIPHYPRTPPSNFLVPISHPLT